MALRKFNPSLLHCPRLTFRHNSQSSFNKLNPLDLQDKHVPKGKCVSTFSWTVRWNCDIKHSLSKACRVLHTGHRCPQKQLSTVTAVKSMKNFAVTSFDEEVQVTTFSAHPSSPTTSKAVKPQGIPLKKRKKGLTSERERTLSVVAYHTAREYDLESIQNILKKQDLYRFIELPNEVVGVLHAVPKYSVHEHLREIFFFQQGSVVFWDVPMSEILSMLTTLQQAFPVDSYNTKWIKDESESMEVILSEEKDSQVVDDNIICMNAKLYNEQEGGLERYAFANAFSHSVLLGMLEKELDEIVDNTRHLIENLKSGRRVGMSHEKVQQLLGSLFELRHTLNLSSDLLGIPDFYWDRSKLENLYLSLHKILQLTNRTKVMNEKLNYNCEMIGLLNSLITERKNTKLESLIILLISIEVVFECIHCYINYYVPYSQSQQEELEE